MKKILLLVISIITFIFIFVFVAKTIIPQSYINRLSTKLKCVFTKIEENETTINQKKVLFQIKQNETIPQIVLKLQEKHIINQDQSLKLTCLLSKKTTAPYIQAGYFIIMPKMQLQNFAEFFQKPEKANISITIPEGLRYDQIAKILNSQLNGDFTKYNNKQFLDLVKHPENFNKQFSFLPKNIPTLEGFLFPDTYEFNKFETTSKDIIIQMLQNFQNKALKYLQQTNQYDNDNNPNTKLSPYQKLIIASIIERETNKNPIERQMVADIIYKRLANNMYLQIDATLLYPKKDWTYTLTYQDLHTPNAYNTYTKVGLPPTPICNPGLSAIQAVANPKSNPYFYYMHDKTGKIHYSTTYNEHLQNVQKYLR